ncbi:MAG: ferredoxin [Anaerolineae bacterium]|nr:ferredoxin [Anaerolineae bacterium]
MKVIVDPDLCLGCAICESIEPDVFRLESDIATVLMDPVPESYRSTVQEAIESCPEEAIRIEE